MLENNILSIIGSLIIILILLFLLVKTLRAEKKIKTENKNNYTKDTNKNTYSKTDDPIIKMIEKLEANFPDKDSVDNEENIISDFEADIVNNEFKKSHNIEGTVLIDDKTIGEIGNRIDKKLSSSILPLIKRVDQDGCILLDLLAVKLMTADNVPIVTPSGAIRVMNFIEIEEDIEISIQNNKPLFLIDKNKKIHKLEKDEIKKLITTEEHLQISEKMVESSEKIKLLTTEVVNFQNEISSKEDIIKEKEKEIIKLKEDNKKLQIQLDFVNQLGLTKKDLNNPKQEIKNETSKSETSDENKENKTSNTVIDINNTKEENSNPKQEINETPDEKKENKTSNTVIDINNTKEENSNPKQEIKNETSKNETPDEKKENKQLNKTRMKKIVKDILSDSYLYSNSLINNKNINAEKLVFISAEHIGYLKKYLFSFSKERLTLYISKIVEKNEFEYTPQQIEEIVKLLGVEEKTFDAFFTDKIEKKIYKTHIIQLLVKEEDLYGVSFNNRYSEIFTLEGVKKKNDIEIRAAKKKIYTNRIKEIVNNNYIELKGKR